jgi:hypothetical protein
VPAGGAAAGSAGLLGRHASVALPSCAACRGQERKWGLEARWLLKQVVAAAEAPAGAAVAAPRVRRLDECGVRELKGALQQLGIDCSSCREKEELVRMVRDAYLAADPRLDTPTARIVRQLLAPTDEQLPGEPAAAAQQVGKGSGRGAALADISNCAAEHGAAQPVAGGPSGGAQPVDAGPSGGAQQGAGGPSSGAQPIAGGPSSGAQPIAGGPSSGAQPVAGGPSSGAQPVAGGPSSSIQPARACASCGATPGEAIKLRPCACRLVRYCGERCQTADWPGHKAACKEERRRQRRQQPTAAA